MLVRRNSRILSWPAFGWVGASLFLSCLLVMAGAMHVAVAQNVSLSPADWIFRGSPGMGLHPVAAPGGWKFDFPSHSRSQCNVSICSQVHYLTTALTKPMASTSSISMTLSITASPGIVFDYHTEASNTCPRSASVRLYFQQQGDDLTMAAATYRWWSNPSSFVLAPTDEPIRLSVPLRGDKWTDVNGMTGVQQPNGFAAALAHPANVGLTFGGGCFFGHGVFIDGGTATFTMTGFSID
jgi:hypothetical protein